MYFANGKLKKKYGIVDERKELMSVCDEWSAALKTSPGKYLHGNTITMPDLMVFGVLRGIAGLPAFSDVMHNFPDLMQWYVNVSDAVMRYATQ